MKRLIEQTACEHGKFGPLCLGCTCGHANPQQDCAPCPGGSSREVTVDYLAAAKRFLPHVLWSDGSPVVWEDASEAQRGHARDAVSPIVDAALERGR